jgi:hypothetical protein
MADDVELPDLEVLARYSLAVRAATAPREEVIEVLEADLAWLRSARPARRPPARAQGAPARRRRVPRPSAQ